MNRRAIVVFIVAIVAIATANSSLAVTHLTDNVKSSPVADWHDDVLNHQGTVNAILDIIVNGSLKGQAFDRLARFVDTIGPRLCGSAALNAAAEYMLEALRSDGLDNVHGESVMVPNWVRGKEFAQLKTPRQANIALLGLGMSVGTGASGIQAPVIVVESFDELQAKAKLGLTQGKIIVYNQQCDWKNKPIDCYGTAVAYRYSGASQAARAGGVAALVRSVTPMSIYSPHTGIQAYDADVTKIPVACITVEDAEMMARMQKRGQDMTIFLYMEASFNGNVPSMNVVAEWTGSKYPEQVVIVSGHMDSWDVGQGAMDDGGGAIISWITLLALRDLGFRPKRTVRFVMWNCEEFGGIGGQQYFDLHKSNLSNYDLVMESDLGVFSPFGIQFTGSDEATKIMTAIAGLMTRVNATQLTTGGGGEDISPWMNAGVPGASLANDNTRYFWFHHSNGDTMTVMDPDAMDLSAAVWAATAFVVADIDTFLPRNKV